MEIEIRIVQQEEIRLMPLCLRHKACDLLAVYHLFVSADLFNFAALSITPHLRHALHPFEGYSHQHNY